MNLSRGLFVRFEIYSTASVRLEAFGASACEQRPEGANNFYCPWRELIERNHSSMRISSVIILLSAIALSGCDGSNNNVNSNANSNANANRVLDFKPPQPIKPLEAADPNFKPCNPYFPLVPGSIAKYMINYSSGITGDLTVIVDASDEGGRKVFTQRSQLIDRSGGMQISQSVIRK